jgi:hypothetical protein
MRISLFSNNFLEVPKVVSPRRALSWYLIVMLSKLPLEFRSSVMSIVTKSGHRARCHTLMTGQLQIAAGECSGCREFHAAVGISHDVLSQGVASIQIV